MKEIVSVDSLSKDYIIKNRVSFLKTEKKIKNALKNITFKISEGEIVGYIGNNGAGKSTTIKLLLGILTATKGSIKVLGKDPFVNRQSNAKNIGVLFGQKSHLWWDLPLIDSFKYLSKIYDLEDEEWLNYLIKELNVTEYLYQPVRQLSLGQRMRGEFIASIIHKPKLVFLDEPTIGLDIETKRIIIELILKINKQYNTTIILTTHEISDIEKTCKRMILISDGQITYDGAVKSFKDIFNKYKKIKMYGENLYDLKKEGIFLLRTNIDSKEFVFDESKFNVIDLLKLIPNESIVTQTEVLKLNLQEVLLVKDKLGESYE
ncbi:MULTISPECIES: ATP-binding cassette domain-containing protein [unclassified Gemella]|uniref:ABC transporter ATP-binding protein n=1 Tax=unclassified Gemella TaxID=2624949 RepID=UPI001C03BCB6|nr:MULTISPECIES: ATP-binding cassette domain-containing protein [unclassified Gemella]MBU0279066.1 ATP-binding cassette domain-containing protein [Gemella sp. zg-1178]QWQ39128.1 ATP-binding cassette domain-containing protein [Gemella sp. zg-570]